MTGEEIYRLSKESAAARVCIPLELMPTMPLLSYRNGWVAEFWYYREDYREKCVFAPQKYLALRLPGGQPLELHTLQNRLVCLGQAPELFTKDFYHGHTAYLKRCEAIVCRKDHVSGDEILLLQEEWFATLPAPISGWMKAHKECGGCTEKPSEIAPPANTVEYWQREMALAMEAGDMKRVQTAQREMNRAAKTLGLK